MRRKGKILGVMLIAAVISMLQSLVQFTQQDRVVCTVEP